MTQEQKSAPRKSPALLAERLDVVSCSCLARVTFYAAGCGPLAIMNATPILIAEDIKETPQCRRFQLGEC